MKQTPLTNMKGRWVHSTKEAFDALVEMGYEPYTDKYLGYKELEVVLDGIIFQGGPVNLTSKQAYYHNGNFYDHPYEEFTITEEKVPFPELEDIEWVMVESHIARKMGSYLSVKLWDMLDTEMPIKVLCNEEIELFKTLYENSKDFKVSFKLKEKINRKLHENRPLAMAVGRWLYEAGYGNGIKIDETTFLARCSTTGKYFRFEALDDYVSNICTLPDDYIIPDQVLQWMKEYQEQGIK